MKTNIIQDLESHIAAECRAIDEDRYFDDMLDEIYSFEDVGGPFAGMSPSRVLKEVDPIAYRCGKSDYFGSTDEFVEVDGSTYRQEDVEEAKASFVADKEKEIAEIENDISMLEEDPDEENEKRNETDLKVLRASLAKLKAELAELEAYSF